MIKRVLIFFILSLFFISSVKVKYRPGRDKHGKSEKDIQVHRLNKIAETKSGALFVSSLSNRFKAELIKITGPKSDAELAAIVKKTFEFFSQNEPARFDGSMKYKNDDFHTLVFPDHVLVVQLDTVLPVHLDTLRKDGLARIPEASMKNIQGARYVQEDGEWRYDGWENLSGPGRELLKSDLGRGMIHIMRAEKK